MLYVLPFTALLVCYSIYMTVKLLVVLVTSSRSSPSDPSVQVDICQFEIFIVWSSKSGGEMSVATELLYVVRSKLLST